MSVEDSLSTTAVYSWDNRTELVPTRNSGLQLASDILVPAILGIIMLTMGSGVTLEAVKSQARRPAAPVVGLLSQFIVMPACAFGMAHALRLESHHAIGMMVVASCPGGSVSNIFTYWSQGDLSLSICMTLLSTILSLGFLPLNLFIYLRSWTDDQASVPYGNMVISIAVTWIPVAIGLYIRYKAEKIGLYLVKIGSVAGIGLIVGSAVIQNQLQPGFLFSLPWTVWVAAFSMPAVGFAIGFLISSIACFDFKIRRTVAYESGIQNSGVALTLFSISYSDDYGNLLSQYPLIFAAGQMSIGLTIVALHNIVFLVRKRRSKKAAISDENVIEEKEAPNGTSSSQLVLVEGTFLK